MPVIPMQKAAIFGHAEIRDQIVSFLQKAGVIEITAFPAGEKPKAEEKNWELELLEIDSAIKLLENTSGKKRNFIEAFAPPKETVSEETLAQTAREFDWQSVVKSLEDCETRLANLKNLEHTLRAGIEILLPWEKIDAGLDQLACTAKTCVAAGACKTRNFPSLKNKLEKLSPALHIEAVNQSKENIYLLIFYLAAESKLFHDLLSRIGFEKAVLPVSERSPANEIAHHRQLLAQAEEDKINLINEIKSQLKHKTALTYVYDYFSQNNREMIAKEKIGTTRQTFILTGWIPKKELKRLKDGLQKISPLSEVQAIKPAGGEIPPTLIENLPVFRPFELITRIFGLPGQHEIDPTGPLSLFYLLFFAMCLSDVGYGVILSIVSYYFQRTLTLSEGGKKLLSLLFWGGIATIFIGVITGSYFGLDINQLPPVLRKLQIIDPIKNPLNVLILSLALGVVQNLFGLGIAMYWKIINREYTNAFLDYGLWIYFLLSLVAMVAAMGVGSALSGLFANLSIIGAVLLMLTQGRGEPTLFKKAISGILSLYRTTGYLGDTLSYSRLLALMMTTSIIGMVVNIIASLTRESIPVLGYVLMVIILVLGHVFNLVVSVLGAFIHSARLQLVEFFGKFYEGSGREFKPFCRETKYVIIK